MADTVMPDAYDRLLGALDGLPGVLSTKPATVQQVTPLLGTSQTFIVRTVRQQERTTDDAGKETAATPQFTVFLEHVSRELGHVRLALPPRVAELIARQRDALTTQAQRKAAKRGAAARKASGIVSGFKKKAVRS